MLSTLVSAGSWRGPCSCLVTLSASALNKVGFTRRSREKISTFLLQACMQAMSEYSRLSEMGGHALLLFNADLQCTMLWPTCDTMDCEQTSRLPRACALHDVYIC
jgi:hypothetical protein